MEAFFHSDNLELVDWWQISVSVTVDLSFWACEFSRISSSAGE